MTSNDLEMTFNYVFSTYLILLPPNNTKMEITPPYYHRYPTLVYIFKKICSEKVWYENIYLLFLRHNQHPYQYQGWAQGEDIIKKKDHPNICFHPKVMSYFRNLRWPLTSKILKIEHIFATEADIGIVFFLNDIRTFISNWLCDCHLGRTYMSDSRRENAYVNFNLHKKLSFLYFLFRFLCKCII